MNTTQILWPVLIQVILTLIAFLLLGVRKVKALKAGGVDRDKTALNNSAWPDDVVQVSNNIQNQFQTPVLFYVLSFMYLSTNGVTTTVLALSWLFVVTRIVHMFVHIGSNYVPMRFRTFMLGTLTLMALAGILATNLVSQALA